MRKIKPIDPDKVLAGTWTYDSTTGAITINPQHLVRVLRLLCNNQAAGIQELNYQRERGLQVEQELRNQGLTISERPHEDDMQDNMTQ